MENRKTYRTRLDFDKVLDRVADLAVSSESREKIRGSEPYTDPARVSTELHLTDSLMDILERGHNPGISSQDDIPAIALRAEKGGVLFMGELLHVARALENARRLRDWYQPSEEKAFYGDHLFFDLYSDNGLERQIRDAILSDTEMADEASPALADIRRRIMRQESSIRDKLDTIIKSSSTSRYLQEAIVTMRGGRFVVPVKLENRNAISGLVHDVSSSGSTIFVEPTAVVEANNRIMQLKAEEQAEIDRILAAFSARVQGISQNLVKSHKAFTLIDIALAKARYALSINAVMPDVNDRGFIDLRRARHPLIDKNTVVPIDVRLGKEFTTLVITGPNTGGKTVSLKTVGLLTVMACCGIPIPASPGSEVAVFERVLADIGDEQSIEQSLSTFSSHITNVIEILKVADRNSLVLLDELGAGTDPEEGAALAEAILERLRKLGCRVFATTHYAEIKLYAMQTEGVTNASCEFDVQTLSPTYHLSIGVPGRSNALLICERLGLDADIIEDARYGMAVEDRRFEDAISEIDALKADLNEKERQIEDVKAEAAAELEKARNDARDIRKKADAVAKEVSQSQFETMVASGGVQSIVVYNKEEAEAVINDSLANVVFGNQYKSRQGKPKVRAKIGSVDTFEKKVDEWKATGKFKGELSYDTTSDLSTIFWYFGPVLLLIGFWFFFMKRMGGGGMGGGGIFNVGKSKAMLFDKDNASKVTFEDVAGLAEAKVEIAEIVDFLKSPEHYTELGGKIPKGALLVGPPGTGKTLLAKAVAGEANVPFFSMSGSDFVEMFVGVGASRVRDLFRQAKEKAPCIVFIDEIDAVGRARGRNANMGGNDERESTLNQLLTEMDGFGSNSGVIILAATNRADILDKALLRAGRFDRQIYVELPELTDRKEIFLVHLRNVKTDGSVDIDQLARQTPGFSGADIANVCNEAALIAARRKKQAVQRQDFMDAIDRIIGGLEKKSKVITDDERKSIAYHEAGHATVSWHLQYGDPLIKVTIVPRGKALGAAWYMPEERQIEPKQALLDEICSLMAGRVAEDIFLGFIDTGALNDLERATKMAYAMVTFYGMSDKMPNISYYDSSGQEYGFTKPYSETRAQTIDAEVQSIIDSQYERARQILLQYVKGHHQLAELLLEREVIYTEDAERIFGKRQWLSRTEEIMRASEKEKEEKEQEQEVQADDNTSVTPPPFIRKD